MVQVRMLAAECLGSYAILSQHRSTDSGWEYLLKRFGELL